MFTPNLPELIPQDFKGYKRVAFDDLTLSERHHLQRLGTEHLPQYALDELAIYRCPEGITFFGPLEFVRGAA